jgi:hypothetical protein
MPCRGINEMDPPLCGIALISHNEVSATDPHVTARCSGLRTVGDGLANSRIPQPTILVNKQSFWLKVLANGPTIQCEELANNARD